MKRNLFRALPLLILALLLAVPASIVPAQSAAPKASVDSLDDLAVLQKRVQAVVKRVRGAVVGVRMGRSSGSGCFISADGWVATAGHVSGQRAGTRCRIIMHGGKMLDAVVKGYFQSMDYGLIKADTKGAKVPFCELGESGKVVAGQWLIPMGHPLGPEAGRDAVVRAGRCLLPENGNSMIVIDAPVISGDSGGPVFDLSGKIIAINQSIQTNNVHINNVTPVALLKKNLAAMKEGKKLGMDRPLARGTRKPAEGSLTAAEQGVYRQAMAALTGRKLKRSVQLFDQLTGKPKLTSDVLYNAACAYSLYSAKLKGKEKQAMAKKAVLTLRRATDVGWKDVEHAKQDSDLDPVRDRKDFQEWILYCRRATIAPVFGLQVRSSAGIRVNEVMPGSPAERAGFKVDDIIERIGKSRLKKKIDWIGHVIGKGIPKGTAFRIKRAGRRVMLKAGVPSFGARVTSAGGAKIRDLTEGGLAFNSGFKIGDVIIRVGDLKIKDAMHFANVMMVIDGNEEILIEVKRGYARERIKFSYSTGDLGEDGSGVLPAKDWKHGANLLGLWESPLKKYRAAVFPVKQKGKQVAFATAIRADGMLVTKASQIDEAEKIVLLDGSASFEAKVVARNDRYDVLLLKTSRKFSVVVAFAQGKYKAEFPEIGTILVTVDANGEALALGFVALPPYDTDKIAGRPDPNSPFVGINAQNASGGGARITVVTPGMPAANGGMKVGDVLKKLNGQEIKDWTSLRAMILGFRNDQTVTFEVLRDGKTIELKVTLMPRAEALGQSAPKKGTGKPELGIKRSRAEKSGGIKVGLVKPGSPAELAGINSGDVILEFDGKVLKSQRELDVAVASHKIGDRVMLKVKRDAGSVEMEIELSEEDAPPPPPGGGRPNVKGPVNDRATHFGKVIQHDGVVLPAHQGSPVFDLEGKVVGFNIARCDRTRTFALPAERMRELIDELLKRAR